MRRMNEVGHARVSLENVIIIVSALEGLKALICFSWK
jgi:hypothetical protein